MDGELEEGEGAAVGAFGADARGNAAKRPGPGTRRETIAGILNAARRPGREPARELAGRDAAASMSKVLRRVVRSMAPSVRDGFAAIRRRREELCYYSPFTVVGTALLGFVTRSRSMHGMDGGRNDPGFVGAVAGLFGQPWLKSVPSSETLRLWLGRLPAWALQNALCAVVRALIRSKTLAPFLFFGMLVVAIDGTKRENCRKGTASNGKSWRNVLVASVVTPWGEFAVAAEPVDMWDGEAEKADCERNAAVRLCWRVKREFPHMGILLLADGLYACRGMFALCDKLGWEWAFTFKEGSASSIYADAVDDMALRPQNAAPYVPDDPFAHRRAAHPAARGTVAWATDVDWLGRKVTVVRCEEEEPQPYKGAFVTSLRLDAALACMNARRACAIATVGRRRWHIESQNHDEKHNGYGLGHNFCDDDTASKNIFMLMEIAHLATMLFAKGQLHRLSSGCRHMTVVKAMDTIRSYLHVNGLPPADEGLSDFRFFPTG